jgi:hypothetical protein
VLNPFTADLDNTLHEHLEMENADVTVYINAFEIPVPKDMYHVVLGKIDPQGKITYNKQEFFFNEEQLNTVCDFFGNVKRKLRMNNSHALVENFRLNWLADEEKQIDFAVTDDDHVDLTRVNLSRDIQDSVMVKTKMRSSKDYCKRFYATLCNNELYKDNDVIGYSWRSTGALVADILCTGDYLDWYCSGNEGYIDEEVEQDLLDMGWQVKPYPADEPTKKSGNLF